MLVPVGRSGQAPLAARSALDPSGGQCMRMAAVAADPAQPGFGQPAQVGLDLHVTHPSSLHHGQDDLGAGEGGQHHQGRSAAIRVRRSWGWVKRRTAWLWWAGAGALARLQVRWAIGAGAGWAGRRAGWRRQRLAGMA